MPKRPRESIHQKGARRFREEGHRITFSEVQDQGTKNERYCYLVPSESDPTHFHMVAIYTQADGETCPCEAYTVCHHIVMATLKHAKIQRRK